MGEVLHSKTGASSMYRWEACPGSVALCSTVAKKNSAAASEGTLAHEKAAEALLLGDPFLVDFPDVEMLDAVALYVETIENDGRGVGQLYVEHQFDLSAVAPGCFGTADAVLWLPQEALLRVYDFKYGRGVHVAAEDNSQLLYYALGAAITLGFPLREFENVIVQPRCRSKGGAVRRARGNALSLLDFWERLRRAAERTTNPDAPLAAGRHCYFCDAKNVCPAHLKAAHVEAAEEFEDIL